MRRRIILSLSSFVFLFGALPGPVNSIVRDIRIEQLEILRTDPATLRTAAGQRNWTRSDARLDDFTGAYGQDWRVRWNEFTGTPHRMFGGQIRAQQLDPGLAANGSLRRDDILRLAEQFTRKHRQLLGVDWDDLSLAYADLRGGRWVVTLKQMSRGIEVIGGRVDMRFSPSGTLMLLGADVYPVPQDKATPRLSAARAWQSAIQNLPSVLGEATSSRAQLVYLPMLADEPRNMGVRKAVPRRQVSPADLRVRAAYRVHVRTEDPVGDWETYVDAATGTILSRENRVHFAVSGAVTGDIRPLLGTDTPVVEAFPDQSVFGGVMVDTVVSYDFESGAAGWSGQSPWALSGESVNSGSNAWSDSPSSSYNNNLDLLLTSPTIDISSTTDPVLSFFVRMELEDTWDFLYVEASDDNGATWKILDVLNRNTSWHEERVDLQDVEGTSTLKVRFRLFTDSAVIDNGCWVDDVTIASLGSDFSDGSGNYSLETSGGNNTIQGRMVGRYTRVDNLAGPDASMAPVAPGATQDLLWSDSNSTAAERDVYKALSNVHARMKQIDPNFTDLDYPLPIFVGQAFCNAYWAGSQIVMGAGSAGCANLANWMPVMYHEHGHGVTDHIYDVVQNPPSSMNEGFSDYIAATITDDPRVGPDILGPGSMFRNIENKLRTPEDLAGEVHHDGAIIAAALWDMRRNLLPNVALADSLFHFARFGFPMSFEDYLLEVLTVDDDDANLGNGTPHITEIQSAFGEHGIGLGPEFQHVDVVVQDAAGNNDGRLDPGETADLQLTLRNYGGAQADVSVRLLSTLAGVTVVNDSVYVGAVGADTDVTAATSFTVQVSSSIAVGTALTFDLDIQASGGFNGDCFMLPAGFVAILLVDDDRHTTQEAWYQDSLDRLGKGWTRWEAGTLGSPPAEVMAQYRAVIWHTGNDRRTTLAAGDQEELAAYLGAGGNLFLTGEDIGVDLWNGGSAADVAFYETWLRAQVNVHDEGAPAIVGEAADVIGDGLSFSLNGGSSAGNQASVSSLSPQGGAVASLRYTSGRVAALRYDGTYRLFYCGFGFEGVNSVADRDTLMSRAMAWLCPEETNLPSVSVSMPNGGEELLAHTAASIQWTASDDVAVLSVDILLSTDNGANYIPLATGVPNTHAYQWIVNDIPSSTCLIRVEASDPSSNVGFDVSDAMFTIATTTDATTSAARFALHAATPNPFNPMTTLHFDLPRSERVWLEVWSVDGRHVRTLVAGERLAAGSVQRVWNGRDDAGKQVASGVYVVRLRAADFAQSRKVQLLK